MDWKEILYKVTDDLVRWEKAINMLVFALKATNGRQMPEMLVYWSTCRRL